MNVLKKVMKQAWKIRKAAAKKFNVKLYEIDMSECLKISWTQVKNTTTQVNSCIEDYIINWIMKCVDANIVNYIIASNLLRLLNCEKNRKTRKTHDANINQLRLFA
jgi:hypothetical protein